MISNVFPQEVIGFSTTIPVIVAAMRKAKVALFSSSANRRSTWRAWVVVDFIGEASGGHLCLVYWALIQATVHSLFAMYSFSQAEQPVLSIQLEGLKKGHEERCDLFLFHSLCPASKMCWMTKSGWRIFSRQRLMILKIFETKAGLQTFFNLVLYYLARVFFRLARTWVGPQWNLEPSAGDQGVFLVFDICVNLKTLFSLGQQLVYKVGGKHCENNSFIIRYGVLSLSMAIVLLQLFSLSESNLFDLFYSISGGWTWRKRSSPCWSVRSKEMSLLVWKHPGSLSNLTKTLKSKRNLNFGNNFHRCFDEESQGGRAWWGRPFPSTDDNHAWKNNRQGWLNPTQKL